jgi:hypothetical protein
MRYFGRPTQLDRLSLEARIVYTGFAIFMLLGFASSAWLYGDDDLGVRGEDAVRYYLGEQTATKASTGVDAGGPALELPEDTIEAGLRMAKPPRQVMETFHFHLLTVPVCLLIVAHLFMMSRFSTKTKAWVIGVGSVATLLHVLLPPLIRFVSVRFAPAMFPSAAVMGVTWVWMTAWPIYEMWRVPLRGGGHD